MDIITLIFLLIIVIVLAFIIANAGSKRKIGFGWSLFLGLFLSPIVSFVAVLLSDKIESDEFGRVNRNWGCLVPSLLTALIILTTTYLYYSAKERRITPNNHQSTISLKNPIPSIKNLFQKDSSDDLEEYKIQVDDGKTENEKTIIIKFNNMIEKSSALLIKHRNGNINSNDEIREAQSTLDNFLLYLQINERNISESLMKRMIEKSEKFFGSVNQNSKKPKVSNENKEQVNKYTDSAIPIVNTESLYRGKKSTPLEVPVDLNDYFNAKNGWDEETDWNHTGPIDEEEERLFDKVLKDNSIYYSDKLNTWVKKK